MKTLYGLPENVEFCKLCTISNQRPCSEIEFTHTIETKKRTIYFEDGICDACRVAERKKNTIDWEVREAQLKKLCDRYRKNNGEYDCLVPGSGGKDSFYAAHVLKYKYGMNPLTCTWAPALYTEWGQRNYQRWLDAGFDNIRSTHGEAHRLLTRLAVDNLLHIFQTFILGQKNFAPKVAHAHGIKLIWFGECEAEYGNPISDNASSKRDWSYFTSSDSNNIFLGGVSLKRLIEEYGFSENDLHYYIPINPRTISDNEIETHYLGYYLPWHPQKNYYYAVEHGGFEVSPERTPGTYSKYSGVDDMTDDLHFFTTHVKFGIGRATYDSSQEIRNGDLTREEGIALVKRYDGEYPERFEKEVFEYLNLPGFPKYDRESFLDHCDKFRSPHLWDGRKLRHTIYAQD